MRPSFKGNGLNTALFAGSTDLGYNYATLHCSLLTWMYDIRHLSRETALSGSRCRCDRPGHKKYAFFVAGDLSGCTKNIIPSKGNGLTAVLFKVAINVGIRNMSLVAGNLTWMYEILHPFQGKRPYRLSLQVQSTWIYENAFLRCMQLNLRCR